MPVHLFGRPAPLERARRARPAARSRTPRRRSARPGSRGTGVASTFSFFPTKNLFGLGDGGLVAVTDEELAERVRHAPLPRLARRRRTFELRRLQLAPRRAPGRRAAPLPARTSTTGRRCAARPPRATASSASASSSRRPTTSPATSTTCSSCRSPERDRIVAALAEAEIGCATYYLPPLHLQPALALPRLRARARCPRPSRPRARTSPCRSGPASRPSSRSASSRSCAPAVGASASRDAPGQPAPALAARSPTRSWSRSRGASRSSSASTRRSRRTTSTLLRWRTIVLVVAIKLAVFVAVRLLQPLVALRLDAGHVGRRARRRRRLAARRPRGLPFPPVHTAAPAARRSR